MGSEQNMHAACIARDTDDVADAAAFAPANQALAAETGIAAHDEASLRPGLTQASIACPQKT